MDISELFDEISIQMRSRFAMARKAMQHGLSKGSAFEDTVRGFFRDYLPSSLAVSSGFLIDSTGAQSRQLDIIIHDRDATPVLYWFGETRIIPVECAYAVIEVKATAPLLYAHSPLPESSDPAEVSFF